MKIKILLLSMALPLLSVSQANYSEKYQKAFSLLDSNKIEGAYKLFKDLKTEVSQADTLYTYVIWYYLATTTELESMARMKEDFSKSLEYGKEALGLIQDYKDLFDPTFSQREYWMIKNIIVSNFGLGKLEEAEKYKGVLYQAYTDKTLPKGIDGYFNFSFFKWKDKNVWGYEWYPLLPANRFSTSFTKVVYYIYGTNPDGSDKDQLFRFHVLMFHQDTAGAKFDYILERQMDTDKEQISGSYYRFTYKEKIDYVKLKKDILYILENDLQPDSRRVIPKNKQ